MSILGPISLEVYSWDADWLGCNGLISYCVWGFFWGRRIQWWLWKELKSKVYWVFILGYIILDVLYSYKKKNKSGNLEALSKLPKVMATVNTMGMELELRYHHLCLSRHLYTQSLMTSAVQKGSSGPKLWNYGWPFGLRTS